MTYENQTHFVDLLWIDFTYYLKTKKLIFIASRIYSLD